MEIGTGVSPGVGDPVANIVGGTVATSTTATGEGVVGAAETGACVDGAWVDATSGAEVGDATGAKVGVRIGLDVSCTSCTVGKADGLAVGGAWEGSEVATKVGPEEGTEVVVTTGTAGTGCCWSPSSHAKQKGKRKSMTSSFTVVAADVDSGQLVPVKAPVVLT